MLYMRGRGVDVKLDCAPHTNLLVNTDRLRLWEWVGDVNLPLAVMKVALPKVGVHHSRQFTETRGCGRLVGTPNCRTNDIHAATSQRETL